MEERRKHKRYAMPRGTFFILRHKLEVLRNYKKMGIKEIAMVLYKTKLEAMAQIKNMGQGGVAFDGNIDNQLDFSNVEMDVLMAEKGLYMHNIPYSTLYTDALPKGEKKTRCLRTNALQFKELGLEQKRQLDKMLSHRIATL